MSRKLELSRRRKLTFIASLMQKVERRAQESFEVENGSVNARMVQKVGRQVDGDPSHKVCLVTGATWLTEDFQIPLGKFHRFHQFQIAQFTL